MTDLERGPNLRADATDALAEGAAQLWRWCRIGSCGRHRECMYAPCRAPRISIGPRTKAAVARLEKADAVHDAAERLQRALLRHGTRITDGVALAVAEETAGGKGEGR